MSSAAAAAPHGTYIVSTYIQLTVAFDDMSAREDVCWYNAAV